MNTNNNPATDVPAVDTKKSRVGKIWVVIVLLVGLIWGILISDLATLPQEGRPDFFRGVPYFNPGPSIRLHVVLTTIEVALLLSLVVIYLKVYSETKAPFSLGLVAVLGALLLQTVLSYPLILGLQGVILLPGLLSTLADILTLTAYTIFLYLSLE